MHQTIIKYAVIASHLLLLSFCEYGVVRFQAVFLQELLSIGNLHVEQAASGYNVRVHSNLQSKGGDIRISHCYKVILGHHCYIPRSLGTVETREKAESIQSNKKMVTV